MSQNKFALIYSNEVKNIFICENYDLIEASLKTGITYKTFEQVPKTIRNEVKEILNDKGIEV
jgi:hypothetical protein